MDTKKLSLYAPVILRIGIAIVYLWFGFQQFIDVTQWVGFIPDGILAISPVSAETLVYMNAAIELVFGTALLFGFFTRTSALVLALHMLDITVMVGYDAIGVRDFGIVIATIAIMLFGEDMLSLDKFISFHHEKIFEDPEIPAKPLTPVQLPSGMVDRETMDRVIAYIKREQTKGTPINNIRDSLFIKGWAPVDIDNAYKRISQDPEDKFVPQA